MMYPVGRGRGEVVLVVSSLPRTIVSSVVVGSVVSVGSVAFVMVNWFVDILYAYLDPRIRLE